MLLEWPLVGRHDELTLVEGLLAGAGHAGVVLAGGAGVGKTRLANEVLERAEAGGRAIARVQATRSASSITFGAFAHLLPPELGGRGPLNLLGVAGDAITARAANGPIVLGIDDAHLLDASSAALARHLSQSGGCFFVVTLRRNESVPDAVVSLWKDGPLQRIELSPLSLDDVAELLPAVLGGLVDGATVHRLWTASRGNPLYLREIALGGVEDGSLALEQGVWRWRSRSLASGRLTELVDARLGELCPAERAVLEIVAHAEPLEADFLDGLTELADRESVERRGLLDTAESDGRRTVRLSHPLYAETLRATTPPSRTSLIWRGLSDQLDTTGARRIGDVLRLATWRLGAGDVADAALFTAAAQQAVRLQDFPLGERLARTAVRAGGSFSTRLVLANALVGLGRGAEAETLLADLEASALDDEQRTQAALRRSDNLSGCLGDGRAARLVLDDAVGSVTSSPWRESVLSACARLELFSGDAGTAVSMVAGLLERDELDQDILVEVWPLAAWGRIVSGRPRSALEFCDRLLPLAMQRPGGQHGALAPDLVSHNRCAAAMLAGRLGDADQWSREAYESSAARGADASLGLDAFTRGWTLRVIGRIRPAAAILQEAAVALGTIDLYRHRSACLGELAHCQGLLGDVGAAEAALTAAESCRVPSFVMDHSFIDQAAAWVAHARGEHSRARDALHACALRSVEHGQIMFAAFAWHDLARMGDPDAAAGPLASLAPRVEGSLVPAFATHALAMAARHAAELDGAAATFEELGALLYAAEAAAMASREFRRAGRTGSALTAAATAHRLSAHCAGAHTPSIDALDSSLPLTKREREIATLAALGNTNKQIAEHLVVSVRTVDNHLHRAYTKLGITHRQDLAAIVLRDTD